MATAPNVLGLYGLPNRKVSLIAVSNAICDIEYKERLTLPQIAAELDVDTVDNAKAQNNLLNFVAIARMMALWPQHTAEIRNLWEMHPREPETPTEKRRRLIRELAALEDDA